MNRLVIDFFYISWWFLWIFWEKSEILNYRLDTILCNYLHISKDILIFVTFIEIIYVHD